MFITTIYLHFGKSYDMNTFRTMHRFSLSLTSVLVCGTAWAQMPMLTPHVQVEKATRGQDRIMRRSIGHAEAIRKVQVRPAVEGFLSEICFTEGSMVNEGDVLMRINPIRHEAALQQAEAAVAQLNAQMAYAESRYNRLKELMKSQAASEEACETALSKLEELRAELAGAEADLVKARKDLADCTIRAEISGRIGRLALSAGNYVTVGEPLATITQVDPVYMRFPLSQHDVDSLFHGAEGLAEAVEIRMMTANGLRYPHKGAIAIIDNQVSANSDTCTLWAQFDNKDHSLTHGGIGAMYISLSDTAEVTMVPLTAVQHDATGAFVYTVDEHNTVARRNVTAGTIQGRMQTIYEGLNEGESVITDGSHKTRPGATIIPVYPKEQTVKTAAAPQEAEAVATHAEPVTEITDPTVLTCQGARIEAVNRVELRPLVQGLLEEPAFREGDMVEKDAVLFRIDPVRYQAAVDSGKAAVARLEVLIVDARAKYERQQKLVKLNASSKDDMESANATLNDLLARQNSAKAALVVAEDNLSRCTVRAGMKARIGRVNYTKGNYITDMKSPLATIMQVSPIYVRFSLSENEILSAYGNVERLMQEAEITLTTATGEEYAEKGRVSFCDNEIQTGTDTQNVWATFENADGRLMPGGVVTISVRRKADFKVPAVPADAVQTDTRGRYVYVLKDGHAVRTEVLCGASTEDGFTTVFNGLSVGDKVLTTNLSDIEDGTPVTEEH